MHLSRNPQSSPLRSEQWWPPRHRYGTCGSGGSVACSRSAARRSAAGTRSPRLSCLLTLCLGSPEPLGGVKRSGAFTDSGHPVARCALPRVWDSPQDPGRGPGKLWTERRSERRTLGREEGRTAVLPARPHVPVPPPRRWRRQPVRFSTAQSSGTVPDAQGLQGPRESVSCCLRSFARV